MALRVAPFIKVVKHVFVAVEIGVAVEQVEVIGFIDIVARSLDGVVIKLGKLTGLKELRKIGGLWKLNWPR